MEKIRWGVNWLIDNSLLLLVGAIVALLWVAINQESYQHVVHAKVLGKEIHWWVCDVMMAFFFLLAGKEIWEAVTPGGKLYPLKMAMMPLMATLGGMVVPASFYWLGCLMTGRDDLARGWAIPCATDIAFSALVARIIFGKGHAALAFLLLLAVADDAGGLVILLIFYPKEAIQPLWFFGLVTAGVVLGLALNKIFRVKSFWVYLLTAGGLSWAGFYIGGFHPALGLLPIVPTMPRAKKDIGLFAPEEEYRADTLSRMEHFLKRPVEGVLFVFALVSAGVMMSEVGTASYLVLAGLLLGKPIGIVTFSWLGRRYFGLQLPEGIGWSQLLVLGSVAGIGFTVSLFVSEAAFLPGLIQDEAKMGALGSFLSAFIALGLARLLKVKPVQETTGDLAPDLVTVESH